MPTVQTGDIATYYERHATVQEVPDAGHASNLDNPEFFTGALSELLAEVYA